MTPVVPDLSTGDKDGFNETGSGSVSGFGPDSGPGSIPSAFILTQGDPTRLYVEREAVYVAYLVTHPIFGSTQEVAGTYTCVAVGEYSNATKEILVDVIGLFKGVVLRLHIHTFDKCSFWCTIIPVLNTCSAAPHYLNCKYFT